MQWQLPGCPAAYVAVPPQRCRPGLARHLSFRITGRFEPVPPPRKVTQSPATAAGQGRRGNQDATG